ncbi:MAG: chemotaxis protein CheA [Betaproteobacteria bacterium]
MIDLTRFLPMFFQETEEHLTAMEQNLLSLDPIAPDPEALNCIFRSAHSVKGNSAIFGAPHFAEVMHAAETILDQMRKQQRTADAATISLLLEVCDAVREELRRLKNTGETDSLALQRVHASLTRTTEKGQTALRDRTDDLPTSARRSAHLGVHVTLPAGQGITTLPLPQLYAELGTLGRIEDLQLIEGTDGAASLSLVLLTTEVAAVVHGKLAAVLGSATVRVEAATQTPRLAETKTPAAAPNAGYELFDETTSFAQTTMFGSAIGVRRPADHEATAVPLGRRAGDRAGADRSSIRVDVDKVDRMLNLVGELVIAQSMLAEAAQQSSASGDAKLRQALAYSARQTRDLQDAVMNIRLLPLEYLFSRMPRVVRDAAQRLNKEVQLVAQGGETELDKELIEKLIDPLTHLIRNAVAHGIELPEIREAHGKPRTGTIQISATHQGGVVVVEVRDDGAGFDREKILSTAQALGLPLHANMSDAQVWKLVFAPGFTTADVITDVSGRGVGMDVVLGNVRALGGDIDIQSHRGSGASLLMRIPLTLAIVEGMGVEIGGQTFIIPLSSISEAFLTKSDQVKSIHGTAQLVRVRESMLPVISLEPMLGVRTGVLAADSIAIVIDVDGKRAALRVDKLLGQQQVVIKSIEANYRKVPGIASATVMGDGRVALILDVNSLLCGSTATKLLDGAVSSVQH